MSDKNRILIVDDDEVVRWSYLRSLQSVSCNVAAASDGEEALQTMEQNPFDVVLLDMRMPGQDGLSVLRTIKQKWPESEVVIITGYPTVDSAKEAVRLGAYDYVAKPVGPQDVINVTDGAMTRKQWALRRVPEDSEPRAAPARPEEPRHTFKQQTRHQRVFEKEKVMTASRKVLVVDDDPVVRKSFDRVLSSKGYAVITAENGEEAMRKLNEEKYDARLHRHPHARHERARGGRTGQGAQAVDPGGDHHRLRHRCRRSPRQGRRRRRASCTSRCLPR